MHRYLYHVFQGLACARLPRLLATACKAPAEGWAYSSMDKDKGGYARQVTPCTCIQYMHLQGCKRPGPAG